jgi:hypothetical protein
MIGDLLSRAFRQKSPEYIRFSPIPHDDPNLCANCDRPHDEHHRHGACPHSDGSGFMLGQHFTRKRTLTECDLSILEDEAVEVEEIGEEAQ